MIILDENFPESQRQLLRSWRISVRQIGLEVGRKGMKDEEIIPLLLQLRRPSFFTLDLDFYHPALCHRRYCLGCVDTGQFGSASFVRRFLRHEAFETDAKRMGAVVRITHGGLLVWRVHFERAALIPWEPLAP